MTTRKTDSRARTDETVHTSRRSERNNNRDGIFLTGTGISFTAPATIGDTGDGFGSFSVGDRIAIEGTANNNGVFTIATAAAGTLTIAETVVTEAAGNSVTLKRIG